MKKWMVILLLVLVVLAVVWRNVGGREQTASGEKGRTKMKTSLGESADGSAHTRSHVREDKERSFQEWAKEQEVREGPVFSQSEAEEYLAKHGRNAESLVVMAALRDDDSYLKEAEKLAPNDKMVLYALLCQKDLPEEKRAELLARILKAHPESGLAWWFQADGKRVAGDRKGVIEAFVKVAELHGGAEFASMKLDFIQALEDACLELGCSPSRSWVYANRSQPNATGIEMLAANISRGKWPEGEVSPPLSIQENVAFFSIGRELATTEKMYCIDLVIGNAIAIGALNALPEDFSPDGVMSAGEWIVNLPNKKDKFHEVFGDFLNITGKWDEPKMDIYFRKVDDVGEFAAMQWVVEEFGDAAKEGE